MTNAFGCIIFRFVKGVKPDDRTLKCSWGPEIPDSLLHSLSSGLWTPTKFRMPISFSPFLPFRAFGNTAGNGGAFFCLLNYFWKTIANSQCGLPTNWSNAAISVILYPARVNICESRRSVVGLHET